MNGILKYKYNGIEKNNKALKIDNAPFEFRWPNIGNKY